eukprot:379648-Karenia_brevis.AAC.1
MWITHEGEQLNLRQVSPRVVSLEAAAAVDKSLSCKLAKKRPAWSALESGAAFAVPRTLAGRRGREAGCMACV